MRKGFTLVEIMIVVAIIALLAAVAIPGLLRARITANDSAAQATLKAISTAYEVYAGANSGSYPSAEANLSDATPPYLTRTYNGATISGYTYAVAPTTSGYTINANASGTCNTSGTKDFTITTGGNLTSTGC